MMRHHTARKTRLISLIALGMGFLFMSCASVDPKKVDVTLEKSAPRMHVTNYTKALDDLGLMTEVYATGGVKIQSQDVGDETGASTATGGEIQRNITKIVQSTLNAVGGNIQYIPYDPVYFQNQAATGYIKDLDSIVIPDVVVTGGITAFDRGLETRGGGNDASAAAEFTGLWDWLPSKKVGARYSDSEKAGKASITLDFMMKDFQTLAALQKMTVSNKMVVHKGMADKELGVSIFGISFGRKGSIKKVQGRHEAVRLLVQLSMIQLIGRYLGLPYWRLLGPDAVTDPVVVAQVEKSFYESSEAERIRSVQKWLFLHGHDSIYVTGTMDEPTEAALRRLSDTYDPSVKRIDKNTYVTLYLSVPVNRQTAARRDILMARGGEGTSSGRPGVSAQRMTAGQRAPSKGHGRSPSDPVRTSEGPTQTSATQAEEVAESGGQNGTGSSRNRRGIVGRVLSADEW